MIIKCKFCDGNGKIGDTIIGYEPCPVCEGAGEFSIDIPKDYILKCRFCNESGKIGDIVVGYKPCPVCRGMGIIERSIPQDCSVECKLCNGSGKMGDIVVGYKPCSVCKGIGIIERPHKNSSNKSNKIEAHTTPSTSHFLYSVALSFAGEDRKYADKLEKLLTQRGIKVFYDRNETAELWGKNLYQYLQSIYRDKAQFCIVFVSHNYAEKFWPRHELEQAQARAFRENEEYILPVRIDDTEIPGINDTRGYVDLRTTSMEEIADLVITKLQVRL